MANPKPVRPGELRRAGVPAGAGGHAGLGATRADTVMGRWMTRTRRGGGWRISGRGRVSGGRWGVWPWPPQCVLGSHVALR